ncbi:AsmA family protein [Marinoscillum pacificum]|uniref:AsmA family protein n=1 Tax=Marinoscillum pacificum TaxID=392723 RepID=UPI0021582F6B|nr:AsmA family protein [Marinoscillum pacificum]
MKKVLIILASLIGLILLAAVLVPIIFKDDIQAAIDKELDKALNAKVYYDTDAFSVSLFKSFPDISVTVGDFGIVGVEPFEADTLVDVTEFSLTLDIMSVINGEQIEIVDVSLIEPSINVIVLEDGTANYDIAKPSEETEEEETGESAPLSIKIQGWEIVDANVIYMDAATPMLAAIGGLNHSGSGDFSQDVFDMVTKTTVDAMTFSYDGVDYIYKKSLNADITMAMDLANMKFTFKENQVSLSNFGFGFDGYVSMPGEDIDMDITYAGKEINLISILSLIPGTYQEYLDGVTASGTVGFDGYVRGSVTETELPAVLANFSIDGGNIVYADYPIPMEQIDVKATFNMPSADLTETSFLMDKFHMLLDGEEVTAYLDFKDLEDYYWDFRMNGNLDLEKITQIVKLEETTLRGHINAQLETKGRMSDLEAERYMELPTTGSMEITDLYYQGVDLPQGFGISNTKMTLDPKDITLANFKGNAGRTDLYMDGKISNYLAYALNDSAMLYGNLNFSSSLVDVNEWMTEETEEETPEDTSALEIIRIPENIDFVLASNIETIIYDDLELKNFNGKLIIRDGAITMEKVGFNLLDGQFEMNGAYESALSLAKPLYDFDFSIKGMSIASAFKSFTTIQELVPVAEKMTGKFSTDFKLGGSIGEGMMPVYEDMQGAGLVAIANAALQDVKLLTAISNVSKLNQDDGEVTLKDVLLQTEIRDGRIWVEPFDIKLAGKKATVGGSTGVDGTLDYAMAMDVPSGQVGEALNSAISSFAGMSNVVGKDITLNLGIAGTYDEPKVKLLSASPGGEGGGVKAALEQQAKAKINEKKEEVTKKVEAAKDSATAVVTQKVDSAKAEVKEKVEEAKEEAKEELKDEAKDKLKSVFKKKGGGK